VGRCVVQVVVLDAQLHTIRGIVAMLVKVESLAWAIDLYHAGLLRWFDGKMWSFDRGFAEPSDFDIDCAFVELEE